MDAARTRFALCATAALLVHGLAFVSLSSRSSENQSGVLAATRATGIEADHVRSSTRAARNQLGTDTHSAAQSRAATPERIAGTDGTAPAITRFVMVATPRSVQGAPAGDAPGIHANRDGGVQARRAVADQRATYMTAWQDRIEAVAGARYAAELRAARGHSLTLAVRLGADGSLRAVRVMRSSGDRRVDALARRIVAQSAPFPAFDDALARRTDELRFAYDWVFDTRAAAAR